MDKAGKINFTMEIAVDTGVEFFSLKLKINEGKIRADVCAKLTNSFSYTIPNTYYPKNNISNVPRVHPFNLRVCDDDEASKKRSSDYQNYLIARDQKPSMVKNNFLK